MSICIFILLLTSLDAATHKRLAGNSQIKVSEFTQHKVARAV